MTTFINCLSVIYHKKEDLLDHDFLQLLLTVICSKRDNLLDHNFLQLYDSFYYRVNCHLSEESGFVGRQFFYSFMTAFINCLTVICHMKVDLLDHDFLQLYDSFY